MYLPVGSFHAQYKEWNLGRFVNSSTFTCVVGFREGKLVAGDVFTPWGVTLLWSPFLSKDRSKTLRPPRRCRKLRFVFACSCQEYKEYKCVSSLCCIYCLVAWNHETLPNWDSMINMIFCFSEGKHRQTCMLSVWQDYMKEAGLKTGVVINGLSSSPALTLNRNILLVREVKQFNLFLSLQNKYCPWSLINKYNHTGTVSWPLHLRGNVKIVCPVCTVSSIWFVVGN